MNELEQELSQLESKGEQWIGGGILDRRQIPAILLLTKAVLRLDESSTFLARVNIALGGIVILIGVLQVILMLRGH